MRPRLPVWVALHKQVSVGLPWVAPAIHLPAHRAVFTGDTIANVGQLTLGVFNQDRARTVAAFRRLAELDVDIACFGHGEPILAGAGEQLRAVAATL